VPDATSLASETPSAPVEDAPDSSVKQLAAALAAARPKFSGRHFVLSMDLDALNQAGEFRPELERAIAASPDLDRFFRGSAFVPSEDFQRLAVFFTTLPGRPVFFIGSLKPGKFDSNRFLSERVHANDPKHQALDFRTGRSGTFKALNWRFGTAGNLCLLRAGGGSDFIIGARDDLASMGGFLKRNLANFMEKALALVPLREDRAGRVFVQLKGSHITILGRYGCQPNSELLSLSLLGSSGALADAIWELPPGLGRTVTEDDCLRRGAVAALSMGGLSGAADRTVAETPNPEIATVETNIVNDEMKLFIRKFTSRKKADLFWMVPVDDRKVDYCTDAFAPLPKGPQVPASQPLVLEIQKLNDVEAVVTAPATGWFSVTELLKSARIVPEQRDGKTIGVRIFGSSPDTEAGKLGLQNGDRIEAINGEALERPEQLAQRAEHLSLSLSRRGNPLQLMISQRRKVPAKRRTTSAAARPVPASTRKLHGAQAPREAESRHDDRAP